jgi:hypothetical protein
VEPLQGNLFTDEEHRDGSIQSRFASFHHENPHVYDRLVAMARGLQKRGMSRIGIGLLTEHLRFLHVIRTKGDPFKLNNDYRALYARKIMTENPDLDGIFELRERKTR